MRITQFLAIFYCVIWFYFRVLLYLYAGRDKSIKLIDDANAGKIIGVVKKTRG
jgi:hypothetical protein